MTTKSPTISTTVATPLDAEALVRQVMAQIDTGKGKVSLAEAIGSVLNGQISHTAVRVEVPVVPEITDAHREALAKIPLIYGQVTPKIPRLLTKDEQKAIVEERAAIDVVLGLLATRKDTSIREALASHLDKVAEKDGLATDTTEKDSRGHYALKQDSPVEGTSVKISRSVSEPKPVISSKSIQEAHEAGLLSREDYLALTSLPEVAREFDEVKASKAIKKNKDLLFRLASATTQAAKTTTIKVSPYRG